ncbi:MAG: hypothetical protein ACOY3D_02275, partial [Candidatus Omnitrophota bacterium]
MVKKLMFVIFCLIVFGISKYLYAEQEHPQEHPQQPFKQMDKMVLSYLKIGEILSTASIEGIGREAETITRLTSDLIEKKSGLAEDEGKSKILVKRTNEINEASQRLLQAKSLKEKRIEYEVLSHPMVSYLKRFADKKY